MINDLSNFINSIQNETNQVILLIDVNEFTHSKSGRITTDLDEEHLIDPITNMHRVIDESNTYKMNRR